VLVISGDRLSDDNVHVARSFAEVFQLLSSQDVSSKLERAFVIGGESVYQVLFHGLNSSSHAHRA